MLGELILVGTPIGNLGDFSPRAAEALSNADFIAAEDTRVTLRLLNHFGIKKPLISYFEHNRKQRGGEILSRIQNGETCALVTDAGMPAVSDPGEDLVALCAENGVTVRAVPGPSAAVTAVAVSGLPCARFCFEGFLSTVKKERRARLEALRSEPRTMIFYEAPHRLETTLRDLSEAFGDRRVVLARELTKLHEEVRRTTLSQATAYYAENGPRGEFVLVVEGAPAETRPEKADPEEAAERVRVLLKEGLSTAQAVRIAAKETGVSRSQLYKTTVAGGKPGAEQEGEN